LSQVVLVRARRSIRPWPLSRVVAVWTSVSQARRWQGGKSRRGGERGGHVGQQGGLVVFDREQVMALVFPDFLGHVAVGEHGVGGDDGPAERGQNAE
jgi:hypothetical protein